MFPKMSGYIKSGNKTKYMSFLIKDDELLEKHNNIWDRVCNSIKRGFDSEPVFSQYYLKPKIKSYEGKISTKFYDDEIPKEGSHVNCLSVILINSVLRIGKNYYP